MAAVFGMLAVAHGVQGYKLTRFCQAANYFGGRHGGLSCGGDVKSTHRCPAEPVREHPYAVWMLRPAVV